MRHPRLITSHLRRAALFALCLALAAPARAEPVTLNFRDADIHAVISTVSEITGKNFIVDPRVSGKITIVSTRPMEKDEVYQVFLSVLEVHGFATVPGGKVIKIVPDANAKFGDIPTATDEEPGAGDEIITRVIEVKHVQAAQLVPILRPLASPQGHMAAFPQNNTLIVSDRAGNTERLAKIIRRVDQPSSDEVEIIPVQNASAAELVRILTTLEQQSKRSDPSAKQVTLLADERTNSILVSGDQNERLRVRATISHLDTPIDEGEGNIHVVYLRYAKASDLVAVLTGVGKTAKAGKAPGAPAAATPAPADAGAPSPVTGGAGNSALSIQADDATNALIITSTPEQFRALQSVIRQLDVRRAQVQVEALIAEVSSDKATDLGVQWRFSGDPDVTGTVGAATVTNSAITLSPTSPASGLTLGFFRNSTTLRALINAISKDTDTNVLSTPTLVTLDNQEAEITVGQNVPFITGQFTNTGATTGATNPFQTIERKDVGVKLKIKPQINEGNAVKLDIEQEVSSVSRTTVTGASDLVTNKRSIKTSVLVDDGKIVVLGGLVKDDLSETVEKVPGLGDLPLLGKLFSTTKTALVKTNLMVFLQPTIVRNANDATRLASDKYNYIRAREFESAEDGVELMPFEKAPLLPPLENALPGAPVAKPWRNPDGDPAAEPAP
ncbi:MAG: type II secretion system protein GspD [Gammaproteobacteria bacterium]|nr:MAG: type II secretion system protein GspD [Gammaproteobacteria bacterium]